MQVGHELGRSGSEVEEDTLAMSFPREVANQVAGVVEGHLRWTCDLHFVAEVGEEHLGGV
jgi:hypothetical protein